MAVKLRLARHGRKSKPYYYIIAADARTPRDGKFIERIGSYNPVTNPATIVLDFDRALDWMMKGAQPTETVRRILSYKGVMMKKHLLEGVLKGAFNDTDAENKFDAWLEEKTQKVNAKVSDLDAKDRAEAKAKLEAETKIKEDRAQAIAKKYADAIAEKEAANAPKEEEVIEEAAPEVVAEVKAEEVKVEETTPEVVAEAKAEEVAPVEEAKEEKKEE